MNSLISISCTTAKKGSKVGRTKNAQDKHEIWKEFLQEIGYYQLFNLISELVDNGDEKSINKLKEITKSPNYLLEKWAAFRMFQNLQFVTFEIINFLISLNPKEAIDYTRK